MMDELELFISRVERGLTGEEDAQWFREWLISQPGYKMDMATIAITVTAILALVLLAVSG